MTFLLDVTVDDVKTQENSADGTKCAIAKALKRMFPEKPIQVGLDSVSLGEEVFLVLPSVHAWQITNIYHPAKTRPVILEFDLNLHCVFMQGETLETIP